MEIKTVEVEVPAGYQLILGQSHFIKTVEDLFEAINSSHPNAKFGVAFCESSGKALIRYDGTDDTSVKLALDIASKLSSGHCFVVILRDFYPINVLNRIKMVDEVVNIYCATANKVTVILAETETGRGILGIIDGLKSKGIEGEQDKKERHELLRKIGYKR
jgi:adenosine/AMP kinase